MFVAGLVVAGFIGVVLVLYAADRIVKARAQVRRLRSMSDRLAAATARAEEQQERRQAAARASQELTSVLPAIQRPPLTVPGMRSHGAARPRTGCERPGQQDRRAAQPGRQPSHTGEHPARPGGRAPR
jgi:outer membrane murein-binding lipoprotein Lpp